MFKKVKDFVKTFDEKLLKDEAQPKMNFKGQR